MLNCFYENALLHCTRGLTSRQLLENFAHEKVVLSQSLPTIKIQVRVLSLHSEEVNLWA